MNDEMRGYFKSKLLQKQAALAEMVRRNAGYGREKESLIQDVADMAVESYTREFIFGKNSGDRHMLQLIDEALGRIEDDSYGTCVHCEESIHPKRLEAVPWTAHCVRCQGLLEKGLLDNGA